MAIIKCKMCGGDMDLSTDKTFGTCECCGSVMTLPRISDDQRATAFNRGNHFRRAGEFDKALSVYERIVAEDDTDAEAHWCSALCRFGIEYVEDPATYEWLPTCHRASFDSFLEDVDYLAAVEHSDGITRRQYQKDAAKIAEVQRGILATSQNEEPFDVFICYKESDENGARTKDSTLAQDIYYQLTEQGRRVFFARITLEDKGGAEYEPYIFAALNSAKVMVAVGTKPEYFNAVWVKNEWSRFLSLMKKDHSKLLLPCYRDMDPYNLPEALSVLQSYDMSKIGFIQDLIRGVNKVLDAAAPKASPAPVVQQIVQPGNASVEALLKRGNIALEDQDWKSADELFDRVLDLDAEYAGAYLGKFLAEVRKSTLAQWSDGLMAENFTPEKQTLQAGTTNKEEENRILAENVLEGYLQGGEIIKNFAFDFSYSSEVAGWEALKEQALERWNECKKLLRAESYAKEEIKKSIMDNKQRVIFSYDNKITQAQQENEKTVLRIADEYAQHLSSAEEAAREMRRKADALIERNYQYALSIWQSQKEAERQTAVQIFKKLSYMGYKEAKLYVQKCAEYQEELKKKEDKHRELRRLESKIAYAQRQKSALGFLQSKDRKEWENVIAAMEAEIMELKKSL